MEKNFEYEVLGDLLTSLGGHKLPFPNDITELPLQCMSTSKQYDRKLWLLMSLCMSGSTLNGF